MDQTVLPVITPMPAFTLYLVKAPAQTEVWYGIVGFNVPLDTMTRGCRHLIAAYYSFIYPERMKD